MLEKFSSIARSSFMQNLASFCISKIDPVIVHNIEKYLLLSKIFYYTAIEDIEGDYLEFGVYTGSSFSHAIRCYKKSKKYQTNNTHSTNFFGFDSFDGFGELDDMDKHPFFVRSNFITDYDVVSKRVSKIDSRINTKLIKGFYCDSLKSGPEALGINKARIIFVDCDTYTAAKDVFHFCKNIIQPGTIIVLDDYMCYRASNEKGVSKAFFDFIRETGTKTRIFSTYGVGAHVYVVNDTKEDTIYEKV